MQGSGFLTVLLIALITGVLHQHYGGSLLITGLLVAAGLIAVLGAVLLGVASRLDQETRAAYFCIFTTTVKSDLAALMRLFGVGK